MVKHVVGAVVGESPRRTIAGKLNRLVIVSIGLALLSGALLSCWGRIGDFAQAKRDTMVATANVFAAASSKAVVANDAEAVTQALRAVARVPGILYVRVRTLDGSTLAEIGSGARLAGDLVITGEDVPTALALLATKTLTLTDSIVDGGRSVGQIELVTDASDLAGQFWGVMGNTLLASAVSLTVGLILAARLKRTITRPLQALTRAMLDIERTGELSRPVNVTSDDEAGMLAARFNSMIAEIRDMTGRILAREKEIIERLGRAGEMRDDQTGQHVVRVAQISRIIATELGLAPAFIEDLCRASPMHDVGKIAVPDAILHKPGRLDPEERREMERHAMRGYEILQGSSSELVQLAAEIALSHHERWDGQGYPRRIAGPAIPLSGRITAVADVCDALLSERPYKTPWPLPKVRDLLIEEAGSHFDPSCVRALVARWDDLIKMYVASTAPGTSTREPARAA